MENLTAGRMHFDKWLSFPARLCTCFLEALSFVSHNSHLSNTSFIFSGGSVTDIQVMFIVKPSQVKDCVGAVHLSKARSKPKSLDRDKKVL